MSHGFIGRRAFAISFKSVRKVRPICADIKETHKCLTLLFADLTPNLIQTGQLMWKVRV